MSLATNDIFGAFYKKFADTANLWQNTATTGSFFNSRVDKAEDMPYIVWAMITTEPVYTFNALTTPFETMEVQIDVFDDSSAASNSDTLIDNVEAAFGVNGTAMTFEDSTYSHMQSVRVSGPFHFKEDGVWQTTVNYQVQIKKL